MNAESPDPNELHDRSIANRRRRFAARDFLSPERDFRPESAVNRNKP